MHKLIDRLTLCNQYAIVHFLVTTWQADLPFFYLLFSWPISVPIVRKQISLTKSKHFWWKTMTNRAVRSFATISALRRKIPYWNTWEFVARNNERKSSRSKTVQAAPSKKKTSSHGNTLKNVQNGPNRKILCRAVLPVDHGIEFLAKGFHSEEFEGFAEQSFVHVAPAASATIVVSRWKPRMPWWSEVIQHPAVEPQFPSYLVCVRVPLAPPHCVLGWPGNRRKMRDATTPPSGHLSHFTFRSYSASGFQRSHSRFRWKPVAPRSSD